MIFAARGLLVSLAFFATVYCLLSAAVVLAWRSIPRTGKAPVASSAGLLFGLRIFPFVVSLVVAAFFAFPSFWLMEKAALDEDAATFVLAACSLLILGAGLFRLLRAETRTASAVTRWMLDGSSIGGGAAFRPTLNAALGAPALLLVGIRKPRVLVSDMAASVLSASELEIAVRHELGHKRSRDNLKKVFISATPFPGMGCIESAWREAAELAADDAAVKSRQDALDLATALIKLSRSSTQRCEPALASSLVNGSSSISLRVRRLIEWRMNSSGLRHTWPLTTLAFVALIVVVANNYGTALVLNASFDGIARALAEPSRRYQHESKR